MQSHGGCEGHHDSSVMLVAVVIVHFEPALRLVESTLVAHQESNVGLRPSSYKHLLVNPQKSWLC